MPTPVVSNIIQNEKNVGDLTIVHFSGNQSSVRGGQKIILLLNKPVSKNVKAYFTDKTNSKLFVNTLEVMTMYEKSYKTLY